MNQREAFEAWQLDTGRTDPMWLGRGDGGNYGLNDVQAEWGVWQAAWKAALASQWQPISTAPKVELQDVILYNGTVLAGQWWEGYWVDSCSEFIDPQPTMWQPLPPEPAK